METYSTDKRKLLIEPFRSWKENGLDYLLVPEHPALIQEPAPVYGKETSNQAAEEWIQPWKDILSSGKKPCPTLWTYHSLAYDLGGQPDPQRRTLFANIIQSVKWPRGSITFWPYNTIQDESLTNRLDLFFKGLQYFRPTIILVFGKQAAMDIFPDELNSYGFHFHEKFRFLYLPGPSEMLPDNKKTKKLCWDFMKRISL